VQLRRVSSPDATRHRTRIIGDDRSAAVMTAPRLRPPSITFCMSSVNARPFARRSCRTASPCLDADPLHPLVLDLRDVACSADGDERLVGRLGLQLGKRQAEDVQR
jgi:hypothetical protein